MSKRILAISDGSDYYHRSRQPPSPEHVPRKRKSRWSSASDSDRTIVPGMPTQLPPNLTPQQEKVYILQLQIEDLSRRLKCNDLGIPKNPEDRSPSPEPIYSTEGKRLNTREYRTRKKMEDDRHSLVQQLMDLNPEYKPPSDYKPPLNRITDKVFIPQDSNPAINFVGLLIGPRGNTLKALEKETGAKIIIRGKGSVKDGKVGRRDGLPMPGEDEPLHAFVSAPVAEAVEKAVRKITQIIRQGIEVPECQNDLRKAQLRELALLNGTLREHEGLMKLRAMAEAQSIATNKIRCGICGGAGHLSTDCKANLADIQFIEQFNSNPSERAKMDSEYTALMAELGVGPGALMASGMGRMAGLTSQSARPPRQPPPPGIAPSEEDEDNTTTTLALNGSAAQTKVSVVTPATESYPYALPPPPLASFPPVLPGAAPWPAPPMMMPPMTGYPPVPTYPPIPSAGTGVYTVPTTTIATSTVPQWSPVSTQMAWSDPTAAMPSMAYGAPAMVPAPYAPVPNAYWGTMYSQPIPPPPPPPPPGV